MTAVKYCGITRLEDAMLAADLGAAAVGLILWPGSPRAVAPSLARAITQALPPFVTPVLVMVSPTLDDVRRAVEEIGTCVVQLHGPLDLEPFLEEPWSIVRAATVEQLHALEVDARATLLLDACDPERHGGTGTTVDWAWAARAAAARRVVLAGGLRPENVARAIHEVRPYAVDVASGVEVSPGVKDPRRMRAFAASVREADARMIERAVTIEAPAASPWFGRRDPDARGYYGAFGGRYVPETLVAPIEELEAAYLEARADPAFTAELMGLLCHYAGRPTAVWEAARLRAECGGAAIYLKREDLTHTGAHKINNALGQALLARRMRKARIVAETGAGQHGVASATACALLGLECVVYMGAEDMARQALNVFRMRLLGATVVSVDSGSRTLKDAINEAMRDWVSRVGETYYLLGSALGPHPYPLMVREFQSVIGREARAQILEQAGRLPDAVVASVGGGSNAIGIFDAFIDDEDVRLIGVEAGGEGIVAGRHAARFAGGGVGVLQGTRTFVLQDAHGNIEMTHSVSAGLDYAAVGPEHAFLQASGRAEYVWVSDADALAAFQALARLEGILPALESAHAIAHAMRLAPELGAGQVILVNLSGRGDKDVQSVERILGEARRGAD